MRDANDRFLDAFEEVTGSLIRRSGGGRRESARDAVIRAHRDGVLDGAEATLLEDCCPLRNSLAHHRVDGRTMLTVSQEALAGVEALRHRLVGAVTTVKQFTGTVTTIGPQADMPCHDVPARFADAMEAGSVLGALLVTKSASANDDLMGIITPRDLPQVGLSSPPRRQPAASGTSA